MQQKSNTNYKQTSIIIISLALLYVIAGKLSFGLLSGHKIVNIGLFASEGFALAFALEFGKKAFFGVFLGQFILAMINNVGVDISFGIALTNSTEALLGIYLFNKFKLNKDLNTFKDIIGLLLIITFILQIYSALVSNLILLLGNYITLKEYFYSSFSWWFGNVMGQFLITPFLLSFFRNHKDIKYINLFLHIFSFAVYIYLLEVVFIINSPLLLLSLTIPPIIYITSKKGTFYGISFSVTSSLMSSFSIYLNMGIFYTNSNIENIINYNLFVLAHVLVALTAGALFHERIQNEINLNSIIHKEIQRNKNQQLLMLQQSRLAQMGEMIAMIAHQWRQPLNNLSLVNQLLISRYKKGKLDDETIKYFRENSKKQIEQMSNTIDDFRNFFKSEKVKEKFCVNDVMQKILNMIEAIYTNNNITISFDSNGDYHAFGYPNELGQAILNIVNNAKDALMDKNIEDKHINISLLQESENIVINISDNAGGIPEEIMDKIFDPYFSTKNEKNGTGLGLYMTKIIIEDQMDAKITAKNSTEGATFKIYLKHRTI